MSEQRKTSPEITAVAALPTQIRPLAKARPRNHEAFAREVATEVRGLTGQLGAAGWRFIDIATELGCSETQLRAWRDGEVEPRASVLKALHALVAAKARRAG